MNTERIYLDYNATTPLCKAAQEVLQRSQLDDAKPHNASSMHEEGRQTRAWMDEARWRIARCLGVQEGEIVFTSGGTESNNLAIIGGLLGWLRSRGESRGGTILTTAIEHHCVLSAADWLKRWIGTEVIEVSVDEYGRVSPEVIGKEAQARQPALISVMAANNEVGTRQPVEEIGRWCRERGILFHVDAVQLAGKASLKAVCTNADFVSLSGHKIYGPHGVGALYVRAGTQIESLTLGGWQEMGRRAGTENAAAALAMAVALEDCEARLEEEGTRQWLLVEELWKGLVEIGGVRRNGHATERVPNTLNVTFTGVDQQTLLMALDLEGLSVSSGSACVVGTWQPSHVLRAMGLGDRGATVRFSLGRGTTASAVDEAVRRVREVVGRLRDVWDLGV
jgi:cysteine desulfurase